MKFRTRHRSSGLTLAEYALIITGVGIMGLAGLSALRTSTVNLYQDVNQALVNGSTLKLLSSQGQQSQSGSAGSLARNGYYQVALEPDGSVSLGLVDSNGAGTNVSSIDGSRLNTLGSMMIANTLEEMAQEELDPELSEYYGKLARISYYLGAAEGELDEIPGLAQANYSKGDALSDIYHQQKVLRELLQNPPSKLDPEASRAVMPLAAEVSNIAQGYLNALDRFIDKDGKVTTNIGIPDQCLRGFCALGNGNPGSAIQFASKAVRNPDGAIPLSHSSYDKFVSYDRLRNTSDRLLKQNKVASERVKSTLADAGGLHDASRESRQDRRKRAPRRGN